MSEGTITNKVNETLEGSSKSTISTREALKNRQNDLSKRKVRFEDQCRVRHIHHIKDMPPQIIYDAWYSRQELFLLKKECKMTVKFASRKGESIGNYQLCTRGLESLHPNISLRRSRRRRAAWDLVLDEQTNQELSGTEDPEIIAKLCANLNENSIKDALIQAVKDTEDLKQLETGDCIIPLETQIKLISFDEIRVRSRVRHHSQRRAPMPSRV